MRLVLGIARLGENDLPGWWQGHALERRPVPMPRVEMGMDDWRLVELSWGRSDRDGGKPLFVVEAEKVTLEVEAPATGRVAELCAEPGTDVRVGEPVLMLDTNREET